MHMSKLPSCSALTFSSPRCFESSQDNPHYSYDRPKSTCEEAFLAWFVAGALEDVGPAPTRGRDQIPVGSSRVDLLPLLLGRFF